MKTHGLLLAAVLWFSQRGSAQERYREQYRPQVHFSPAAHWTNDPNGMVFFKGIYHLFFQYFPDSTVEGMHWGHATSADLVHWKEQPIALYPDSLGYIFSGSAVVDQDNTSGLGSAGHPALVAIYTNHDPVGEKQQTNTFQNQSIAYSLDAGATWKKYSGNPVLKNPGITDFRDPKVMWYAQAKKWIMTLATKDRITFYSSPDLKIWSKESEFGKDAGAHGGVWECPDLFPLDYDGKKVWVLIVNVNPGGPNNGSATQYFLGDFNGNKFTTNDTLTKWIDYGPDEYAGITWSNTGSRKIFLGWMSNWLYANVVPTRRWQNAMTIPRALTLKKSGTQLLLGSEPVSELRNIEGASFIKRNHTVSKSADLSRLIKKPVSLPCRIELNGDQLDNYSVILSNDKNERTVIGYDKSSNQYFIDRKQSGRTDFHANFAERHTAPGLATGPGIDMSLIIDESSVELFADKGLTVMTEIFFPNQPYSRITVETIKPLAFRKITYTRLKSIWP